MPRLVVAVCVALTAALLAHVAIDIAGDFLLARDTYDAIDHRSRGFVVSGALGLALLAIASALNVAFGDARGSERAFCALADGALPRSRLRFIVEIVALSFFLLLGMEALDVVIAGQRIDDARDLLGGSLVLGPAILASCGALLAAAAWQVLRRVARAGSTLARVIAIFFRAAAGAAQRRLLARIERRIGFARAAPALASRLAGRAPPPTLRRFVKH